MTEHGAQSRNRAGGAAPAAYFAWLVHRLGRVAPRVAATIVAGMLTLGPAARPALAYDVTLNLSGPPTVVVGQPVIFQASGFSDYPFVTWLTAAVIPATVVAACPAGYGDATQIAFHAGGVVLEYDGRESVDAAGNYTNTLGYTPTAPGAVLICAYTQDGATNTFAAASFTLDVQAGQSTASTTTTTLTTTTLPPCAGVRCTIDAAVHGAACAGESVPPSVTKKLDRAVKLAEQANAGAPKKAKRLRKQARNLMALAGSAAVKASTGSRAKLTTGCAAAIRGAADGARGSLVN